MTSNTPSSNGLLLEPADIVEIFFSLLQQADIAAAEQLMADDIVWRNTTLPTAHGVRWVTKILKTIPRAGLSFAADIDHIASGADGLVLTERTDYLRAGPVTIKFWVCGTFIVRDNKIVLWSDRFSWENVVRGTVIGLLKAPFRR